MVYNLPEQVNGDHLRKAIANIPEVGPKLVDKMLARYSLAELGIMSFEGLKGRYGTRAANQIWDFLHYTERSDY